MKCQICDAEATIHFKEVMDGEMREMQLCETCAEEKGFHLVVEQNKLSIANQFIWMAENLYPESAAKVGAGAVPLLRAALQRVRPRGAARLCRLLHRLRGAAPAMLRRVHGSTRHAGKAPGRPRTVRVRRRDLDRLQEELKRAIEREDFERAARLRDQIRAWRQAARAEATERIPRSE